MTGRGEKLSPRHRYNRKSADGRWKINDAIFNKDNKVYPLHAYSTPTTIEKMYISDRKTLHKILPLTAAKAEPVSPTAKQGDRTERDAYPSRINRKTRRFDRTGSRGYYPYNLPLSWGMTSVSTPMFQVNKGNVQWNICKIL